MEFLSKPSLFETIVVNETPMSFTEITEDISEKHPDREYLDFVIDEIKGDAITIKCYYRLRK